MTSLPSRRRRNTLLALGAGILAAVLAPTLVYVGAKAISNSKAGKNALGDAPVEQTFPETPTGMLATVNAANELTSVTVFVLAPDADQSAGYDQRGGSAVSVPINADAGGDQILSLHDAYALGGEDELRADLESAINLTIDVSRVMSADEVSGFFSGLPPVQVDLPADVLGADETVLYPRGRVALSPVQIAQVLTTRSPTQREALRRPNLDALWSGIAAVIGTGRPGQTLSAGPPTTFDELAARLTAGSVATRGLLSQTVEADRNPENLDVEALDRPDTVLVFASVAPASMTRPANGPSYRIEAPPGYDRQVRKTIAILLSYGGNVVSVDLRAAAKPETVLSVYDAAQAKAEPTDNSIFGKVTIETPDVRLGGVDETISLGTDYLQHVDLSAPDAVSTPSTDAATETTG